MTTQQHDMEKIDLSTDIAVIGSGYISLKAAIQISKNGYNVILAQPDYEAHVSSLDVSSSVIDQLQALEKEAASNTQIEILPQANLLETNGIPGDFTMKFICDDQFVEKKAGAIVLATDLNTNPLHHIYGLEASDTVVSVSDFEDLLADDAKRKALETGEKSVAFLVGFAQPGNPVLMKRILTCVADVAGMDDCSTYVYVNDLKVAEDGLEKLYKKGRDSGAIYFKLQMAPSITQNNGDLTVSFHDPVIRKEVELAPDLIVVEEAMLPDQINYSLAEILNIDQGPIGFLQNENVHRIPVDTNREGIFVVGSGRDLQSLPKSWADIDNMLLRIKKVIGDGTAVMPKDKAVVDREKCTICLTCFRCCPHGAIYWDDKAIISPLACQACGICASECPMDAIQIGVFTDTEMGEQIQAAASKENDAPKIVAFCCQNSAYEAGTAAELFKYDLPKGLQMIKIPCAGKVDINYVLNAFVEGADGVLVLACHTGNCKSERGNTYAKWRINDAYRKMEIIGLDKNRLEFATLASNMASDFARIVIDMEKRISQKED